MWLTGPVAPWHVGSSQTGARTRVPCIGRQILNHCATREAPVFVFNDTATTEIYTGEDTLSLHDALPIYRNFFYFYIYFWLCWVFVSVRGLSLVVASGGHSSSRCAGLSLSRPLLLQSTGSRRAGSAAVARGPSRSAACGIFPNRDMNPCPLHWQAHS